MYKIFKKAWLLLVVVFSISNFLCAMEVSGVSEVSKEASEFDLLLEKEIGPSVKDFLNDITWLMDECEKKASKNEMRYGESDNIYVALLMSRDLPASCARFAFKLYEASLCHDASNYQSYLNSYQKIAAQLIEACGDEGKLRFVAVIMELIATAQHGSDRIVVFLKSLNKMFYTKNGDPEWQMNVATCCSKSIELYENDCTKLANMLGLEDVFSIKKLLPQLQKFMSTKKSHI